MKISYNWLKEYVRPLPKPEKLADLMTLHSFEVKEIEKKDNDCIFNIDILPNRAHDCLSQIGVAHECCALLNSKFEYRNPKPKEDNSLKTSDFVKVEVKDNAACPRYTVRVITDIKVGPSPKWIQERLKTIGQKSINNIVDATNYLMFKTGQPLHAFDFDKIEWSRPRSGSRQRSGQKTIIVRKAKKGEKIITLDGEKRDLDSDILVIADAKSPLALAGVKGGRKAEITKKTKTIVLESANFNYHTIRVTSKKTGIKTESSLRFENELDPNLTNQAIDEAADLISALGGPASGGQKVARGLIDIYPKKILPLKLRLNLQKLENILGIKVSKQEAIKYLRLLNFEVDNSLKVVIPTIRQDIQIEEDLIEEVARLIGYDKIPATAPLGLIGIAKLDDIFSITNKTKNIFEGLGFTEVYNFSFVGEGGSDYLELENPLSLDLKYLRKDLLVNLLKNVKNNIKSFPEIKIFELGKVYRPASRQVGTSGDKSSAMEEKMLAGIIASKFEKTKGEKFYELKGVIDNLFNKLGITDHWYNPTKGLSVAAEVKIGDEKIGWIREINSNVTGFNLNFEKIIELAREELIYQPSSLYPAAVRDLAVLVNQGDRVGDVLETIDRAGGELVQDVDLFDMYEGDEIPDGKKSLAFHIIYQSYKKTLSDREVDKIQKKIIKELEEKGWEVRK